MKPDRESLAPVYDAPTEEAGRMIASFLRESGIPAFFREGGGLAFDGVETLWSGHDVMKVFVLEADVPRAEQLVQSYLESLGPDVPDVDSTPSSSST